MTASIEECIYEVLDNSVRLSTIVGTRISPASRPMLDTLPCVIFDVSSAEAVPILSGAVTQVTGECVVNVYADSVLGSIDAADAVLDVMDAASGTHLDTKYTFRFTSVSYDYEPSVDGDDFGVYSRSLSFSYFKDSGDL